MPPPTAAERLLEGRRIYHEPDIGRWPRAQQVLERFPDAERVEVASHQDIPGLYGNPGGVERWVRTKREVLSELTYWPIRSSPFCALSICTRSGARCK